MPWKEETVENQRRAFVSEAILDGRNMSELCRKYGVTRRTGYKWLERYRQGQTMENRSTAPLFRPRKTPPETESLILSVQ